MRRTVMPLWLLIAFVFILVGSRDALAEKRVALVIGNSDYQHATPLKNPKNDAVALAAKLKLLKFDVVTGTDLTRRELEDTVRSFARRIRGADVALLFYAGHGLQVDGQNYLAPVDAKLGDEADLDFETVPLRTILRQMEREVKTSLVFLDACRDNPLAQNMARTMGTRSTAVGRGLARVSTGIGTLIAFATEPGNVALDGAGDNSPFTTALLKHIETPGLDIAQLMRRVRRDVMDATASRQVPWNNSSLTGDFYFAVRAIGVEPAPGTDTVPARPVPITRADDKSLDLAFWDAVKDSADAADFRSYLAKFPDGVFSELAKRRMENLSKDKRAALAPSAVKKPKMTVAVPVHECDQLASDRNDMRKVAAGLFIYEVDMDKAMPACRSAVAEYPGVARFEHQLARLFHKAEWYSEAEQYYSAAVKSGYAAAMTGLARLNYQGLGMAADYSEARHLYTQAVEKGNPAAMTELGRMYFLGEAGAKDTEGAHQLFLKAIDLGDPGALTSLGYFYEFGHGVRKDIKKAADLYRQAAEAGDPAGMHNLGNAYLRGWAGRIDAREGVRWLSKAVEAGEDRGNFGLALVYESGEGVAKDSRAAARYMLAALKAGDESQISAMIENFNQFSVGFRRELQRLMKDAGVYDGAIDGQFGPGTRRAIEAMPKS